MEKYMSTVFAFVLFFFFFLKQGNLAKRVKNWLHSYALFYDLVVKCMCLSFIWLYLFVSTINCSIFGFCFSALEHMPIAVETDKPKSQHYELPTSFFKLVLGKNLKYR